MTQLYKGNEKRKKSKRKAAQGQCGSIRARKEDTHRVSSWDPPLVGEVSAKGGNRGGSVCESLDAGTGVGAANHGHLARIYLHSFLPDRHTLDLPYAARHWGPSWTTKLLVRLACLGRWAERRLRRKRGR